MNRRIRNGLVALTASTALLSLVGCSENSKDKDPTSTADYQRTEKETESSTQDFFAQLPPAYDGRLQMISEDFDNDGNPDIVLSQTEANDQKAVNRSVTRLYFLKGDGKGNFTQLKYMSNQK
jgi:hypothetical protein